MEHPAFTLSALCTLGGIMGYALNIIFLTSVLKFRKKGSVPSLIGGVSVGLLYGIGGYLIKQNNEYGIHCALSASILLLAAGAPRAFSTKKPVPIALTSIGVLATAYYAKKYKDFYL
ncbi:transmembrane proteins 14C-domain-containing protein [Dipodascopsis uninucleata]